MTVHIALLRAVNLPNHKKVAMADLRDVVADLGFDDVRTLLQSGNLVFSSSPTGGNLERLLETTARKELGLDTEFMVRTANEWQAIIAGNPFTIQAKTDPSHLVVMVCKGAVGAPKVTGARHEVVKPKGKEVYIYYPDGISRSRLKVSGAVATGRNWNTVLKLAEAAKG